MFPRKGYIAGETLRIHRTSGKEQTQGDGGKSVLAEGTDYSRTQTSLRGRRKKVTSHFVEPDQSTEEIERGLKE